MQIPKEYVRNDSFRAGLEKLTEVYSKFAPYLFQKRRLSFHDESGATYTRDEMPHFALTSELLYRIRQSGGNPNGAWWDVCDALAAYWVKNISTGETWPEYADDIMSYIKSNVSERYNLTAAKAALNALATYKREIPYGESLLNPSALLRTLQPTATASAQNGETNGKGKGLAVMAGLGLLALAAVRKGR
jgi:hypothetical protein